MNGVILIFFVVTQLYLIVLTIATVYGLHTSYSSMTTISCIGVLVGIFAVFIYTWVVHYNEVLAMFARVFG